MPYIAKLELDGRSYDLKLEESTAKTEAAAKRMENSMKKAGATVTDSFGSKMKSGAAMLMGALGVGGVLGAIMKVKEYMAGLITSSDSIADSSRGIGITTEQLQGLRGAARLAGFEVDAIPAAFSRMKDTAGAALNGDQAAVEKFNRIGISMDKIKGKKPWEIFEITAEAINSIQDPVEKTNAGIDIFGKQFDKMQELLGTYKKSIDEIGETGIIKDEHIQAANELLDKIDMLQTSLSALVVNSGFIESIYEVVDGLKEWLSYTNKLKQAGVVTREQAVTEAISKAEVSGKYKPEEIQAMKGAAESYSAGRGILGRIGENIPGFRTVSSNFGFEGTKNDILETLNPKNILKRILPGKIVADAVLKNNAYPLLDKAMLEANPAYKPLARNERGVFTGTGQMTMPISNADAEAEKARRVEAEQKRIADAAERARVQEEYKNRLIAKAVEQYKFAYEYQKLINEGKIKEAQQLKLNYEFTKGTTELTDEAKKKMEEYANKTSDLQTNKYLIDLNDQLDLQNLLLNKEYEKYNLKKAELELSGKQMAADESQKQAYIELIEAQNRQNLRKDMLGQGQSLVYDAMRKAGYTKEADRQQALDKAEKMLNQKPEGELRNRIIELADLSSRLSAVAQPDLKGLEIRTNELTSRGGFSTGAIVPDKDAVNKKIAENQKTTNDLLTQIKTAVQRLEEVPL